MAAAHSSATSGSLLIIRILVVNELTETGRDGSLRNDYVGNVGIASRFFHVDASPYFCWVMSSTAAIFTLLVFKSILCEREQSGFHENQTPDATEPGPWA